MKMRIFSVSIVWQSGSSSRLRTSHYDEDECKNPDEARGKAITEQRNKEPDLAGWSIAMDKVDDLTVSNVKKTDLSCLNFC